METALILFVIIAGFVILGIIFLRRQSDQNLIEVVKMLRDGSERDRQLLMSTLSDTTRSFNSRLDSTGATLSQLQRHLGEMTEVGKSMRDLQEFLLSPKLRGNIGEHVLKELLLQMLPKESFHLQYTFRSGEKVDAAIKTSNGIIPIDSKFPMENFRKLHETKDDKEKPALRVLFIRDIKLHIDAISKKYIVPDEGTMDYAVMYIPSEAVYYEVANSSELFDYASKHRILPVSPTTFYAYMKAILMSYEGQKIEESARQILVGMKSVQKDYTKLHENITTLSRHVTNANNMMNSVLTGFSQLGQKISEMRSLKDGGEKSLPQ